MLDNNVHPNRIYPWERWFKVKKLVLKRGEDYQCLTHGMVAQIRDQAAKRKIKVQIKVGEEEITVVRRYRR